VGPLSSGSTSPGSWTAARPFAHGAGGRLKHGEAAHQADGERQGGARRHHNHIFTWEVGDKEATERAFAAAEVSVKEEIVYQRVHPCPLETCACVASMDKVKGELTVWGTFQAPHVVRTTVASLLSGIPEAKIHVIAPDIGGGFGNKVGVYPGCVCAILGVAAVKSSLGGVYRNQTVRFSASPSVRKADLS
jgi:CO/xanthine dehydrogenase Mo-binding subunit